MLYITTCTVLLQSWQFLYPIERKSSVDFMKVNKDDDDDDDDDDNGINVCVWQTCAKLFNSKYTLECERKSKFKAFLEQYHNQLITTLRKDYL
jgi:hypothetical protein